MTVSCVECVFLFEIPVEDKAGCLRSMERVCAISTMPRRCLDDCTFGVKGEQNVPFSQRSSEMQKLMRSAGDAYADRPIKCRNCMNAEEGE